MRRISCSMTVDQVKDRTKTVTRRHVDTWKTLLPLDQLTVVEKAMGLRKGEQQNVLAIVEIIEVSVERLWSITEEEVAAEGFPNMTPAEFCEFWMGSHGYKPATQDEAMAVMCRRIEWKYL